MGGSQSKTKMTEEELVNLLHSIKQSDPAIKVKVSTFHYEDMVVHDKMGTRTVREKKTSFTEIKDFIFDQCQDYSSQVSLPALTAKEPLIEVRLSLDVFPADSHSQEKLEVFQERLVNKHRRRDMFVETEVLYSFPGIDLKKVLEGYSEEFGEDPSGTMCLGPKTKKYQYKIIKKFVVEVAGTQNPLQTVTPHQELHQPPTAPSYE